MKARTITAVILILLGVLLFLEQFTSHYSIVGTWWPSLIIAGGLVHLSRNRSSFFGSLIVITVGVLLQADNLDVLPMGFWGAFWPLILVMAGVAILTKKMKQKKHDVAFRNHTTDQNGFDLFNVFSGSVHNIISDDFKGGSIGTVFGGSEIDLRKSIISPEGANVEISLAFGGIEIDIPQNWRLEVTGFPLFGALDNKTVQTTDPNAPVLRINYFLMFGGIELRNRKKNEF
jgi:predicted membrane protein